MRDEIQIKIEQAHWAVGRLTRPLWNVPRHRLAGGMIIDFANAIPPAELRRVASETIAAIGCLKDHLKAWCKRAGSAFSVDGVLDGSIDAAIVHDLWNADKHGGRDRGSRSKLDPKMPVLRCGGALLTPGPDGGPAIIELSGPQPKEAGSGLLIDGDVFDGFGQCIGRFSEICTRGLAAWDMAMRTAGVAATPPRIEIALPKGIPESAGRQLATRRAAEAAAVLCPYHSNHATVAPAFTDEGWCLSLANVCCDALHSLAMEAANVTQ